MAPCDVSEAVSNFTLVSWAHLEVIVSCGEVDPADPSIPVTLTPDVPTSPPPESYFRTPPWRRKKFEVFHSMFEVLVRHIHRILYFWRVWETREEG